MLRPPSNLRRRLENHSHLRLEFLEQRNLLAGENLAESQAADVDAAFVADLYVDVLDRTGSQAEIDYWVNVPGITAESAARSFVNSREYLTKLVQKFYEQFLDRPADMGGLTYWTDLLATGRLEQDVAASILASPEYFQRYDSVNPGFVEGLYADVLGRTAADAEVDFWVNHLDAGRSRIVIAAAFLASLEFRGVLVDDPTHDVEFAGWYQDYLGRDAEPAQRDFWAGQLDVNGNTWRTVQTAILLLEEAPAPETSFQITGFPSVIQAGVFQKVTLAAIDSQGAVSPGYTGTVRLSTSDPLAVLPPEVTFTSADAGDLEISATFKTAGQQTITITEVDSGTSTVVAVGAVTPAAHAEFVVAGYPASTVVGEMHPFQVTAVDVYGNTVTGYRGTVAFSSDDPEAILPANYTFTSADAGTKEFSAGLRRTGQSRSITVTDVASGATGKQTGIVVNATFVRYSSASNIIYIEGGDATLSLIDDLLPAAPLELVDASAAIWKLDANIRVVNGGKLSLHGTSLGGDVNELRLRSENTADPNAIVEVRADYGDIDIRSTKITSWDSAAGGPDTEFATFKRAFVRARSSLGTDGVTPLESRMDIFDSEIAYLGFNGSESYGLSWKVNGDPGADFELFDQVNVYGDIQNSFIHHNYFGVFAYGHEGGLWTGNEVADNVVYGFDPHDDSDRLTISDNHVHHNGSHGIICSMRCNDISVLDNESSHNGGNGIMLHREADNSRVEGNVTESNGDSGISIYDGRFNRVADNVSRFNVNGIRLTMGAASNVIENNQFSENSGPGIRFFQGTDPPRPGDDARPKNNTFRGNRVTNNQTSGIHASDADANLFEQNEITGNGPNNALVFERSANSVVRGNELSPATRLSVRGTSTVPGQVVVSEQAVLNLNLDEFSAVDFRDSAGGVFALYSTGGSALGGDVNQLTAAGSNLSVTAAAIGPGTTVQARRIPLAVRPGGATATIEPINDTAEFRLTASASGAIVDLLFSGLTPGREYEFTKNGVVAASKDALSDGSLSFSEQPGSTSTITYGLRASTEALALMAADSAPPRQRDEDVLFGMDDDLHWSSSLPFARLRKSDV